MRILAIDIETSPSLAHIWSLWDQTVGLSQLQSTTEVICFAAKWLDEKRSMVFRSVHTHGHEEMIRAAHALLDEADVVMTYNGKKFDVPHLNREFVQLGLQPPAPYAQIDLYTVAKGKFRFISNKLEHVSTELGLKGKVKHEGFELWKKCLAGDDAAWKRMERYNRQDVVLLEDLYHVLQPWIQGHPNRALYGDLTGCPSCGSDKLQRRGFSYTATSKFQRWQCTACGGWYRSGRRIVGSDLRRDAAA